MTRVLLTGGSGFIAAHTLNVLLKHGHSVVTTVRTQDKADKIKAAYTGEVENGSLSFAIVPDIAKPDAFDEAVVSDPPFEAVLHTASPFHFNVTDIQKDLLDPAVIGTTGILNSIKKNAPSVKRVVITSSFAAIINSTKGFWPGHTYSEEDWNPITREEAEENPMQGYRGSKTFAEKAAWDFLEKEKPNFTIATINPPMVFGPVVSVSVAIVWVCLLTVILDSPRREPREPEHLKPAYPLGRPGQVQGRDSSHWRIPVGRCPRCCRSTRCCL